MPGEIPFEIRVQGVLDEKWRAYFAPCTLTAVAQETLLTGMAQDQAELFGILLKIRDAGLSLVSLSTLPPPTRPERI